MIQDKDDILCLRAENTPKPEKVEVRPFDSGFSQLSRWLVGSEVLGAAAVRQQAIFNMQVAAQQPPLQGGGLGLDASMMGLQ